MIAGYDVFISYRRADAYDYAKALESTLEAKGLMVFRDETEEDAGVRLGTFVKRACAARTFVVLATPTVFQSVNVLAELSGYLKRRIDRWHRRPFSRVVSINVAQALSNAPSDTTEWKRLSDFVYEAETVEAIALGKPSDQVVERLLRASSFMRSWRRFILIIGALVVAILLSIAVTSLYLRSIVQELSIKRAESDRLSESISTLTDQNSILTSQKNDLTMRNTTLAGENSNLVSQNKGLAAQATQLTEQNSSLTGKNNELVRQAGELQTKADDLSAQSLMLQIRIAAQNQLADDPVLAYRLAAEAYKLKADAPNRKLILSALSKIDLYYSSLIKDYSIEDFKEPFSLLSKGTTGDERKDFLVLDMQTLKTDPAKIKAAKAWIIPMSKKWRMLTQNWIGTGLDAIPAYQLFDSDGKQLSDPVQSGGLSQIKFLTDTKVSFPLYRDTKLIVWDLADNSREFVQQDSGKRDFDTYYYDIYGALDTRRDGVSAAHYRDGLVLVGKDGRIDTDSYTPVEFDPSAFFSAARWSSDGQYLALNYFDRKRLGIWNPAKRFFIWLDPDRWIVESYSWSLNGHLLAFSGRTENDTNVTVEVVDAASPEQTRRVIYKGDVPIRSMTFLPGDESLAISDREKLLLVIQIVSGKVLETGSHKDIEKLFSTQTAFYSSSANDVRVWSARRAPSAHWLFQSAGNRVYSARGAADPTWNWIAVPFVDNQKTAGLELRKIRSNERLELEAPQSDSMALEFSGDGKWLALETVKILRLYDTTTWKYYDFPLQQDDHQFYALRIIANTVYAHVMGKNRFSSKEDEYDYVIKLDDKPAFISRVKAQDKSDTTPDRKLLLQEIDGWEAGNLYKYQSTGVFSGPDSGWVYFVKCRDQPLGARNCDVQFIPTNLERVMSLYDSLGLWLPTKEELKAWIQ